MRNEASNVLIESFNGCYSYCIFVRMRYLRNTVESYTYYWIAKSMWENSRGNLYGTFFAISRINF